MLPVIRISYMLASDYRALGGSVCSFMGKAPAYHLPRELLVPGWALGDSRRTIITTRHKENLVLSSVGGKKDKAYVLHTEVKREDGTADSHTVLLEDKKGAEPEVITTSCPVLHDKIRKKRNLNTGEKRDYSLVLGPDDEHIGSVAMWFHGPYFGGNPTTSFSGGEQIGPDGIMPMLGLDDWKASTTSVKIGPRMASFDKIALVKNKVTGEYKSVLVADRAFVNSTVHRGVQKDHKGVEHPAEYYTPGSKLRHQVKSSVVETHNAILQTVSIFTNGSADVLIHWILKLIESGAIEIPGKEKCPEGLFKARCIQPGIGKTIATLGDLFTGTPFGMVTITMCRRKTDGVLTHYMVHNRCKSWPANEMHLEFKRAVGESRSEKEFVVYDGRIPNAAFWGDLTVAKLVTFLMTESTFIRAVKDGKHVDEAIDPELLKDMTAANKAARFSFKELRKFGNASMGMTLSSLGMSKLDTRPQIVQVIPTEGGFTPEMRGKMLRELIDKDPGTMEHYFCGAAAKILANCIIESYKKHPQTWKKLPGVQKLWNLCTSKTPGYEQMDQFVKDHSSIIYILVTDIADVAQLQTCRNWAKIANNKKGEIQSAQFIAACGAP